MPNILTIPDDLSVFQFLTYVKLQLENGIPVNDELYNLYSEYLSYCKRNKIFYLTSKSFSTALNKLDIESIQKFDEASGKKVTCKVLSISILERALQNLGGEMTIENIYTVLNNKRYQIQIKIIPLDMPDLEALERQSKEVNLLKKVEPDHSGETK